MKEIIDIKPNNIIKKEKKDNNKINPIKYWEKDYIIEHIDKIKKPKHKVMFEFLYRTGVRLGELLEIRKKDLNFENYTINIRWLKNRKYNYRNIAMHPILAKLLIIYTSAMNLNDKLFHYNPRYVQRLTKKYFSGNPHMFRHSFAMMWIKQDQNIVVLKEFLGHKNIQTTMKYQHILAKDQGKSLLNINFE